METFSPDALKAWAARLGLAESGMAAYLGVPVNTFKKWAGGERKPDTAPLRLMSLLQRLEREAPGIHAQLLAEALASPGARSSVAGDGKSRRGRPRKVQAVASPAPLGEPVAPPPAPEVAQPPVPAWLMGG
jgi:hypothetical protein